MDAEHAFFMSASEDVGAVSREHDRILHEASLALYHDAMVAHAFGWAIGASFVADAALGAVLSLMAIGRVLPAALGTYSLYERASQGTLRRAFAALIAPAVGLALGAVVGALVTGFASFNAARYILAVVSGFIVYYLATDLIQFLVEARTPLSYKLPRTTFGRTLATRGMVVLGFCLVAAISIGDEFGWEAPLEHCAAEQARRLGL
jgi:zinc transporter ZupT